MIDTQRLVNPSPTTIKEETSRINTEREYHNHYAVSNSDLKLLEYSPRKFKKEKLMAEPEENPYVDMDKYMKMGTMIEQNLLEPDRFEENFIEQGDFETPSSPNQDKFVELILSGEYGMVEAHNKCYANSNASKAASLYEKLEDYINFQSEREGKGVYDRDEKETLLHATGDIMQHERACRYLLQDEPWQKTWTQLPVLGEVKGILCKGLIDRMVYDGERLTIIDLKSTSKPLKDFGYWFSRRKYYRQFAHYKRLVRPIARAQFGDRVKIECRVIPTSTVEPYGTRVKDIPRTLMVRGRSQVNRLLNTLKWHIEEDKWDRPRNYYKDGDGMLKFNVSDIPDLWL